LFFLNFAIYEITWQNIVEPDRLQMKIWQTGSWIPKATKANSGYVIFMVAQTHLNVTLLVNCLSYKFLL